MYHFTGFKTTEGTTYFIGEFANGDTDSVKKEFALVPFDADGKYVREGAVGIEVYRINNRASDRIDLDDSIELVNGKYNYNDSSSFADMNGVEPTALLTLDGTLVEVQWQDVATMPRLIDLI